MSCPNYCSGNNPGCLRSPGHAALGNCNNPSSSDVSGGNALCVPNSSCQDRPWLLDSRQGSGGESTNFQPVLCDPSNWEMSHCSSAAYYVPRPCSGTSCIPTASYISSSYLPVPCRPLSCVPNNCRPQSVFAYGYRPVGCLPYGPQPIRIVPGNLRPLCPISGVCQPGTPVFNSCRPSWSVIGC